MENKNTLIALVLMGAVWFGFSYFFAPKKTEQPTPPPVAEQAAPAQAPVAGQTTPAPESPQPVAQAAVEVQPAQPARDMVVDTTEFRAVLTTAGARIKSFQLKKYRVGVDPASPLVELISAADPREATLQVQGDNGWPVSATAAYTCDFTGKEMQLGAGQQGVLTFVTTTASGLQVSKVFHFSGDRYEYNLDLLVKNLSATPLQGSLSLSLLHNFDPSKKTSSYDFIGAMSLVGDKVHEDAAKKMEQAISYQQPVWSLFATKYFMEALIPKDKAAQAVDISKSGNLVQNRFLTPVSTLASGESARFSYLGYFGPRDLDIVKAVDHKLAKSIDFGFFSPLALPLRTVLNFFYGFVGNYGVAIILLTVIIKLLFWPLTQKSYSSMKEMQKLQPEMQRIREKYKKDKERLNQEIMQLYKTKRVNPLGGCLPMIVQIPVFFALYRVLMLDIALRHAPFMFWLTDLSVKDPYYISPLIMGATMFIQQKMTPSSMDPKQAKMFMLMPVIFTFMFLNFPSGLVIYWLVNNLLTILQQYLIHRKSAATA